MATLFQLKEGLVKANKAGNTEAVDKIGEAIRQHPTYQKQGQEALSKGFKALGGDERKQAIHKSTAQSLGIKPSELDSERGMGVWGRTKLSFQPTEQDKIKHLEDTYGKENLRGVDIGGSTEFLYRDEDETGGKWRRIDEQGLSLADFTGDIAGSALPIAGAVGAAVATGGASIPLMAGAAALGGFGASAAQDIATRAVSDEDIQLGEIAKRRGIESAIGIPIDLVTGGAGKLISKRIGANVADAFATGLSKAESRLAKAGFNVEPTAGMEIGAKVATRESVIAGKREGSAIAGRLAGIRDTLGDFQRAAQGGETDNAFSFGKTIQRIQEQSDELVADIAKTDQKVADTIKKSLDRRINRLSKEYVPYEELGNNLRGVFKQGGSKASKINEANWQNLDKAARDRGISTTGNEAADIIEDSLKGFGKLKTGRNKDVQEIIRTLRESGDETIDFKTLRENIDVIQDAVPTQGATGGKAAQQVASVSSRALRTLRDRLVSNADQGFKDIWDNTNKYYADNLLQFKRGAVGKSLAEKLGSETLTGTQVVKSIINDPANVASAIKAAGEVSPQAANEMRDQLRKAYMNEIGLGRTGVDVASGIRFNREIVQELYGYGADGAARPALGRMRVKALDNLNRALKNSKVKDANISGEDLDRLLGTLSKADQDKVIAQIRKREIASAAEDKILDNVLIKKIAKGQFDAIDSPAFADAAYRADPKTIRGAIDKMPEGSKEPFRQDFIRNVFSKAQGGEQLNSRGASLWNPQKMEDILRTKGDQIKAAMGKPFYKDLKAANDFMKASSALKGEAADVALRASGGPQGFHFFLVGSMLDSFRDRFMGWAYGSGMMKPMLKLMNKNVSDEQFAENFKKVIGPMLGTERGIQALARESEQDPQFKAAAMDMVAGMNAQE